jgi:GT2 family glycosyltransferase
VLLIGICAFGRGRSSEPSSRISVVSRDRNLKRVADSRLQRTTTERNISSKRDHPLVFAIVLNWNSWQDTLECISALKGQAYKNCRVLIVDNGSIDNSEQRLRNACPDVEVLQSGANLGYAGGNNVGIRHALEKGARYVLLVNPDVVVNTHTVSALMQLAPSVPNIGAMSPVIYRKDRPDSIWFAGGVIEWANGRAFHPHEWGEAGDFHDVETAAGIFRPSPWASGCCLLLSTEALKVVGLLDENFFLYFEESDLCQRLLKANFAVGVCLSSRVLHQPSTTVQTFSPKQLYYTIRGTLLFFSRHAADHGVMRARLVWRLYRRFTLNYRSLRGLLKRDPLDIARMRACLHFAVGRLGRSADYP